MQVVSLGTIVLWAIETQIQNFSGDTGISALIPVVIFFGLRILDVDDFRGLAWDVLMLLAGGYALGNALNQSGLLGLIAKSVRFPAAFLFPLSALVADRAARRVDCQRCERPPDVGGVHGLLGVHLALR